MDLILFFLRVASALLLLLICGAIFVILWLDQRAIVRQLLSKRQIYGHLTRFERVHDEYVPLAESYPLRVRTTLGRAPTNHIIIDDHFASSDHAQIHLRDGQWWLEDRESRNGTHLNDDLIDSPVIITDGDLISIGSTHFRLTLIDTLPEI